MAVHVVGSINVDIIASVERLPSPGETILALRTERLPGGKGGNQAVAAARMGAATHMVGAVGDDEAGAWMRGQLAASGVEVGGVVAVPGAQTGTAFIAVDAHGENQIIVAPGANADLPAVEPLASGVLLAQLEVPVATLAPLFAGSHARRILNAAPPVLAATALLDHVDILIVNQHELAIFAGVAQVPAGLDAVVGHALRLVRPGQLLIVTLGAGGVVAVWPDRHLHIPAMPVTPVDTIGAGDCFCGALAALLDEGMAIEPALHRANAAAALCTLGHGAAPAMPDRADVEASLAPGFAGAAT
ncbi:ribokinase [Sphingobium sufflavum]|uniref:ribokinase n=1 Tax=Sphingobium sufflavum TaxID=1129547 RepID=UPI001F22434D|nr:ribokinase [Sphingobium sufflavum]MCE7798019.1 ribokinase [Sphingobium sufflavum]